MNFYRYQLEASSQRPRDPDTLDFTTLRLTEEAGEVAGVVKRIARKQKRQIGNRDRAKLQDEMGDVLHSLAKLAEAAGFNLEGIAAQSLAKQAKEA